MPILTLSPSGTGSIPGRGGRKGLIFTMKTGDADYGFESNVSTAGATEGIPVPTSPAVQFLPEKEVASMPVYFAATPSGATILYTEIL
jgi:hypothetical protein